MGCSQSSAQQQDAAQPPNGAPPKGTTGNKKKPVMSTAQRSEIKQILDQQFKVDLRFLPRLVSVKMVMHQKLLQARQNLSERSEQQQENEAKVDNPKDDRPPRISFVQHSQQSHEDHPLREENIQQGIQLLQERMNHLHLRQVVMKDDGNCQFRAMAHQLYGNADAYHATTRAAIVKYLKQHADSYNFYFDGPSEWQRYLDTMALTGTWGDEITLTAASHLFQCTVHVLTSEQENYYMCYKPNDPDQANNKQHETACRDIFLAYISPIHYNSIVLVKKPKT